VTHNRWPEGTGRQQSDLGAIVKVFFVLPAEYSPLRGMVGLTDGAFHHDAPTCRTLGKTRSV
jgi:hypothetical protein